MDKDDSPTTDIEHLAQIVALETKLRQVRDTMKRLFGQDYPAKIAEHRRYIEQAMTVHGLDSFAAAMRCVNILQRHTTNSELNQTLILAALVEMNLTAATFPTAS